MQAQVKVLAVYCDENKVRRAGPGENVRVRLSGVEEEEILSGFVISSLGKSHIWFLLYPGKHFKWLIKNKFLSLVMFRAHCTIYLLICRDIWEDVISAVLHTLP